MNCIPNLEWTEYGYEGEITLEHWEEIFKLTKSITIEIGADKVMHDEDKEITQEHILAYQFILDNQKDILIAIFEELLKVYPKWQDDYGYDEDDKAEFMPYINTIEDLYRLIKPIGIHIICQSKESISYVGYEFDCTWDDEHGFGAMLHKDRIVEIGQADTAILTWIARRDFERN